METKIFKKSRVGKFEKNFLGDVLGI